mmetsp:Transcript_27951/g.54338  ORF Transcript_27951/g.54338 Transcript_27951/m.54338 type:complete len:819 (-) Transcript_27951:271-2727(-)
MDDTDEETRRLEAEFEARMGQMREHMPEVKTSNGGEENAEESEWSKGPSSTDLLMQKLAAMGALDENSAPPGASNSRSPKKPPRGSPKRAMSPQEPVKPGPTSTDDAPAPGGKPKKSKADIMKARFEAKQRRREAERKKREEARKNGEELPKPKRKPKPKKKKPKQEEPPPEMEADTGPSSNDIFLAKLKAMGAFDENSVPPPSGGSLSKPPPQPKPEPKPKPKPEEEKKSSEPEPDPGPSSNELFMKRLQAMGAFDENSVPTASNPSAPKPNPEPDHQVAPARRVSPVRNSPGGRISPARRQSPASSPARRNSPARRAPRSPAGKPEGGADMLRERMGGMGISDASPQKPAPGAVGEKQLSGGADALRRRMAQIDRLSPRSGGPPTAPGGPSTSLEGPINAEELGETSTPTPTRQERKNTYSSSTMSPRQSGSQIGFGEVKRSESMTFEELRAQMEAEHEILNVEVLEMKKELDEQKSKTQQLEEVLTKTMTEFEESIRDSNLRRADDVARIGLQDTELNQLRDKVHKSEELVKQLRKSNSELEANQQLLAESEQELSKQLDLSKKESQRHQDLFEQLKKHAESKLQNAAKLYAEMQKLAEQKIAESQQLTSERDNMRQKIGHLEKQLNTAQQNILMMEERSASLARQLHELQQSSASFKQKLFEANNGFQQVKQQNLELIAINERYRLTITELNEKCRTLQGDATKYRSVQDDIKALTQSNSDLMEKNRLLKSRIFDSMEVEKQMQKRIDSLKAGGNSSGSDDQIAELQQEVRKLKVELRNVAMAKESKEKENKELVNICDDLLDKLEKERSKNSK